MYFSYFIIPVFVIIVFLYAVFKKTNAYNAFIEGSSYGVKQSFGILPYVISMYIAVKVFNASGLLEDLVLIKRIPKEILIQGIFRPFSSNASLSYMLEVFSLYGVDSKEGFVSSILEGGTDTTMYVVTLYFGSIGVNKYRYSVFVGILTDIFCLFLTLCIYFFIL